MKKKITFEDLVDKEQIELAIKKIVADNEQFAVAAQKCIAPCAEGDLIGHCKCYPKR